MTADEEPDSHEGPVVCPVCGADFEAVSVHDEGVMVNLVADDRFERVCLQPLSDDGTPLLRFFQHARDRNSDRPGTAGGRIP